MLILGIETTCDETGIALLEFEDSKVRILKNELASQIKIHQEYGGVVPILAAREHKKNLPILLKSIEKDFNLKNINYLAFSVGPGLLPALVSGKEFVSKLAKKLNKKIIPVDHLSAHIYSVIIKNKINEWQRFKNVEFPALGLVVSGGHTNLYLMQDFRKIKKLGETLDDALGEVLDKCARALGLKYPGGPEIEKYAKKGRYKYVLPKPILERGYNFSFSGLKTAFVELVSEINQYQDLNEKLIADLTHSLQKTSFEILIYKLKKVQEGFKVKNFIITGGVSANQSLRKMFKFAFPEMKIYFPERSLATDNGVNIALAGYFLKEKAMTEKELEIYPRS